MNNIINFVKQNKRIFLFCFFVLTMFLYCLPTLKTGSMPGFIYRIIILFFFAVYFCISLLKNDFKFNKKVLICSIIYLLSSIISLTTTKIKTTSTIENQLIVQSVGDIIINSTLIYFFLDYLAIQETKYSKFCLYAINLLCIFSIIFSLIKDFSEIVALFNNYDHSNYDITSIFVDKNSFGLLLFVGAASNTHHSIHRKKIFILFTIAYFLYSLLIRAKSASFVIFILVLYSLILIFYNCFHSNKKKAIIYLSSILLFVLLLLILILTKVWVFSKFYSVLFDKYGLFYDSKVVFEDRLKNWSDLITLSYNPLVILFGWGERIYKPIVHSAVDNIYLCMYLSGGIIKLILYLVLIFYIFKTALNHESIFSSFIIILIACLAYGFFQDYGLCGFNFSSLGFLLALDLNK